MTSNESCDFAELKFSVEGSTRSRGAPETVGAVSLTRTVRTANRDPDAMAIAAE
jgi:hypothetical protein